MDTVNLLHSTSSTAIKHRALKVVGDDLHGVSVETENFKILYWKVDTSFTVSSMISMKIYEGGFRHNFYAVFSGSAT